MVPPLQVFLREAARQRLQALLHREVLRHIVTLQRRFRALMERKHFVRMREAALCIQVRHKYTSLTYFTRLALSVCSSALKRWDFCFNFLYTVVSLTFRIKSICDYDLMQLNDYINQPLCCQLFNGIFTRLYFLIEIMS